MTVKIVDQIDESAYPVHFALPFSIVNSFYSKHNEIGFYPFRGVGNDNPYTDVNCIFRVYPKGQNPLNIKRNERS